MIPLKDDNPTERKPFVTYFLIGFCILIFLLEVNSQSYRTGELFYSYGLIPSVLMGHNQLPQNLYVLPAFFTILNAPVINDEGIIICPPQPIIGSTMKKANCFPFCSILVIVSFTRSI